MTDEGKSFRERVEEIREKRAQEDKQQQSINQQVNVQGNSATSIDMEDVMKLTGERIQTRRVVIETEDGVLEFTNSDVYKTPNEHGSLYQLVGKPEEKQPGATRSRQPPEQSNSRTETFESNDSTSGSTSNTKVYTDSDTGATTPAYCPGCGNALDEYGEVDFCPACGKSL